MRDAAPERLADSALERANDSIKRLIDGWLIRIVGLNHKHPAQRAVRTVWLKLKRNFIFLARRDRLNRRRDIPICARDRNHFDRPRSCVYQPSVLLRGL